VESTAPNAHLTLFTSVAAVRLVHGIEGPLGHKTFCESLGSLCEKVSVFAPKVNGVPLAQLDIEGSLIAFNSTGNATFTPETKNLPNVFSRDSDR
jgi:hypothetical protein